MSYRYKGSYSVSVSYIRPLIGFRVYFKVTLSLWLQFGYGYTTMYKGVIRNV